VPRHGAAEQRRPEGSSEGRIDVTRFGHLLFAALPGLAAGPAAADGPRAYIISPADGETVRGPVTVRFGLSGMGVAPAGVAAPNSGHHHVLLNRPPFGDGPEDRDMRENGLIADEAHRHFGGGQTEAVLDLAPGRHTLQLVMGDESHVPHDPPVASEVISITVE
jgi:hypothetical protein